MGTYLNPGKTAFEEAVNSEIYVDKTEMILYLNSVVKTKQKYVSVSRPRRFGKTMAADMICAYYDREADCRELFEKRKLAEAHFPESDFAWDAYLGAFFLAIRKRILLLLPDSARQPTIRRSDRRSRFPAATRIAFPDHKGGSMQIGRASCRERV